jgi:hypothetical protein
MNSIVFLQIFFAFYDNIDVNIRKVIIIKISRFRPKIERHALKRLLHILITNCPGPGCKNIPS